MLRCLFVLIVTILTTGLSVSAPAWAQYPTEWEERQNADQRLRAFGTDLLGDGIDPHTGALTFHQTDISIPGNFDLPVALTRRRSQGYFYQMNVAAEFGDWEYVVPRIHVLTGGQGWSGNRCSNDFSTSFPPVYNDGLLYNRDYSNGIAMDVPGLGTKQIAVRLAHHAPSYGAQWPSSARFVTSDNWWLECTNAVNGGQGFIAHAPNGDTYTFNRYLELNAPSTSVFWYQSPMSRKRAMLLATRVTDANGNSVYYDYDSSGRLTRIRASDGRQITLTYSGSSRLVRTATANGRVWRYNYGSSEYEDYPWGTQTRNNVLTSVEQPDGRRWLFSLGAMSGSAAMGQICRQEGATVSVTHPYGVRGEFTLTETVHRQSLTQMVLRNDACEPGGIDPWNGEIGPNHPNYVVTHTEMMSVTRKQLSGPNTPTATWVFQYEQDRGAANSSAGDRTNWTRVTDPAGSVTTYYHTWNAEPLGGLLARQTIASASGEVLQTSETTYAQEGRVGHSFVDLQQGASGTVFHPTHPQITTITRSGDTFTTTRAYNSDFSSSDYSFGFPTRVSETSSLSAGLTRTSDMVYAHNTSRWILGLPASVTRNGLAAESFSYDGYGRVTSRRVFGVTRQNFAYNADGTVSSFTNSLNQTWTLSNWKRGMPQTITRPGALGVFRRTVNDNGWVTSETDFNGNVFGFTYNASGWLTGVTRPSPFNPTSITYSYGSVGVTATSTQGARRETIAYDGYLRPTTVTLAATDGSASQIVTTFRYDGLGRTVFESFPAATATSAGRDMTYDSLSRLISTRETVAPFAATSTAYLSGGRVRVTDPSGAVSTTRHRAFGSPESAEPVEITDPIGSVISFNRDIHGNVTRMTQTRGSGLPPIERLFWYNNRLELCRHRAPEFGDEVFVYNSEGAIIQSGRGATAASGCASSVPTSIRASHSYDAIGRETAISFPSGTPGISRTYDPNGNVLTLSRTNGPVWTYSYNALSAMTRERLAIDARTYQFDYGYDSNGALATRSRQGGPSVAFLPDAYGRPRAARVGTVNHVSNVGYHANGALASASYGNGLGLSQSLNARQLLYELTVGRQNQAPILSLRHAYDPRAKVTSITDLVQSAESRSFTYDANGRVITASGPWGAGSFQYDLAGNIQRQTLGPRTIAISYDTAANRAQAANDNGSLRAYQYDARGNASHVAGMDFAYDFTNQPVSLNGGSQASGTTGGTGGTGPLLPPPPPGFGGGCNLLLDPSFCEEPRSGSSASASYTYDGNLKRVKSVETGQVTYSVYSALGGSILFRDEVSAGRVTDYISAGGAGVRLVNGVAEYTHSDLLGSPRAATSASGALLWRESYTPFGEARLRPPANAGNTGFTGHVEDAATGLTYMQARYYDPVIARFLSTDPIGYQDQLNLYAYVANDPVNMTDPTGMYAALPPAAYALADIAQRARATAPQLSPTNSSGGGGLGLGLGRLGPLALVVALDAAINDWQMAGPEMTEIQYVNLDTNALISMVENPASEAGIAAYNAVGNRQEIISPQAQSEFLVKGDAVALAAFAATNGAMPGVEPSPEMVLGIMMQGVSEADARVVASGIDTAGARTLTRDREVLRKLPNDTEPY